MLRVRGADINADLALDQRPPTTAERVRWGVMAPIVIVLIV